MLKAELRVVSSSQTGAVIPLPEGKFLIGREHDCHMRPNSELVSRHHCAFTVDEYALRLRDLGSTNGTLVNGERLRGTVVLKAGDLVTVGKLEFQVAINGEPPLPGDETVLKANDETLAQGRPAQQPGNQTVEDFAAVPPYSELSGDDTQFVSPGETLDQATAQFETAQLPAMVPGQPQNPAPGQPPGYYPQQQWGGQPGFPYPTAYPPYPGMPYGYGYPYPGVPQMPQQQGYGQPPGYGQQPSAPPESEPEQEQARNVEVRLPDPSETGVKPPEPPPDAKPAGDGGKKGAHIPTAAKDIINSYLNRRPKTE
jgi:pSer/pThr/pTyr-binding forkhead associated (FHA) protein